LQAKVHAARDGMDRDAAGAYVNRSTL
jgi:hypothetical protein